MNSALLALVNLGVALVLLAVARRWFNTNLYQLLWLLSKSERITFFIYALVFLPGVILHEISHWIAAKVLRVQTQSISVRPTRLPDGMIRFGYVETAPTDFIRASLIGIAPLLAGVPLVLWMSESHLGLGNILDTIQFSGWKQAILFVKSIQDVPAYALWLYLLLSISNMMFPSASDRKGWFRVGILLVVLAGIGIVLGFTPLAIDWIKAAWIQGAQLLTGVFHLTIALDLLFTVPLWLGSRILGSRFF